MSKNCDLCKEEKSVMFCESCKKREYCSTACKAADYIDHIFVCPPTDGIKSVDYLIRDVWADVIVTNESAMKDYGFVNCKNEEDKKNLLGLYTGLIKILRVGRDDLHDFCMKDKLPELIRNKFNKMPGQGKGGYYPWFLKHQDIVSNGNNAKKLSSKEFSFEDTKNIVNYGYNSDYSYYFLNVQDPRLVWKDDLSEDVGNVIKGMKIHKSGKIFQLHTCTTQKVFGVQVTVDTLVKFLEMYNVRRAHINKIKEGKQL